MAFTIKYHVLFEVRIFHGFYLKDEKEFYESDDIKKAEKLIDNNYNILNDLEIIPTKECQKLLAGHRLRFKASSFGFLVGVDTKLNENGKLVSNIPIAEGTVFHFKVRVKNTNWTNFSNEKLKRETASNFFFSNYEKISSLKNENDEIPPTLSLQHAELNENKPYEMGEIVFNEEENKLKQAKQNVKGTDDEGLWNDLDDDLKNVSEVDRRLLPSRFRYRMMTNEEVDIESITFILQKENNPISTLVFDSEKLNGKKEVDLDFRPILDGKKVELPVGEYTLKVESDALNESMDIHINDSIYHRQDWGVIAIAHQLDLENYRVLEDDGKLRVEGAEEVPQHPKFEIRIKNRATYWRYVFHPSNRIEFEPDDPEPDVDTDDDFEIFSDHLISKNTHLLSRFSRETPLGFGESQLPNPQDYLVKMNEEKTKFYSDIYLPKMKLS